MKQIHSHFLHGEQERNLYLFTRWSEGEGVEKGYAKKLQRRMKQLYTNFVNNFLHTYIDDAINQKCSPIDN